MELSRVLISMQKQLLDEIDRMAELSYCNRSEYVRAAVRAYMKEQQEAKSE